MPFLVKEGKPLDTGERVRVPMEIGEKFNEFLLNRRGLKGGWTMSRMIPPYYNEENTSNGEKKLFHAFETLVEFLIVSKPFIKSS